MDECEKQSPCWNLEVCKPTPVWAQFTHNLIVCTAIVFAAWLVANQIGYWKAVWIHGWPVHPTPSLSEIKLKILEQELSNLHNENKWWEATEYATVQENVLKRIEAVKVESEHRPSKPEVSP